MICLGDDDPAPPPVKSIPIVTVSGGFGSTLGGWGLQGEYYFGHGRISAFAGVGYWPPETQDEIFRYPGEAAFAMGGRAYTGGRTHRAFVELSVSRLAQEGIWLQDGTLIQKSTLYGPALAVGYHHVSGGGFVFMISAGVGYASGTREHAWSSVATIAIGQMWRR